MFSFTFNCYLQTYCWNMFERLIGSQVKIITLMDLNSIPGELQLKQLMTQINWHQQRLITRHLLYWQPYMQMCYMFTILTITPVILGNVIQSPPISPRNTQSCRRIPFILGPFTPDLIHLIAPVVGFLHSKYVLLILDPFTPNVCPWYWTPSLSMCISDIECPHSQCVSMILDPFTLNVYPWYWTHFLLEYVPGIRPLQSWCVSLVLYPFCPGVCTWH